jgi:dynamin 1-like protein
LEGKPYAVFENDTTNKKYINFAEVRTNIEKLTDEVAGKECQIVNDPIKLRIYSSDCPDLTIIDLPGITRIDVRGQKDIEKITTEMAGL